MPWFEPALIAAHQTPPHEQHAAFAFHDPAVLGTRLNLIVTAPDHASALAAAHRARAEIDRLGGILNWRDPTSELSTLNRASRHIASPDLYAVVSAAEHWRTLSNGAFSPRLGRTGALRRAERASVHLDPATRAIHRPAPVVFELDALAKGYIVDQALAAVMASPGVTGALLDIGGDIRCAGKPPSGAHWRVGLPNPLAVHDNAPLIGALHLNDQAVATSGCGPRDPAPFSATLDPRTGRPVPHRRSVTAIAPTAMDADALATALMILSPKEAAALVKATPGALARVTTETGSNWLPDQALPPATWIPAVQTRPAAPAIRPAGKWHDRWVAFVDFTAPPRQMERDRAFRSPYVAIWVGDTQGRLVRTLFLVGTAPEWQRDNYIWWGLNRPDPLKIVNTRSLSTRNTGVYKVLWDGINEAGQTVPAGRYIIHLETSRERGKHTHRTIEMDFSKPQPQSAELPMNQDAGQLTVTFKRF